MFCLAFALQPRLPCFAVKGGGRQSSHMLVGKQGGFFCKPWWCNWSWSHHVHMCVFLLEDDSSHGWERAHHDWKGCIGIPPAVLEAFEIICLATPAWEGLWTFGSWKTLLAASSKITPSLAPCMGHLANKVEPTNVPAPLSWKLCGRDWQGCESNAQVQSKPAHAGKVLDEVEPEIRCFDENKSKLRYDIYMMFHCIQHANRCC